MNDVIDVLENLGAKPIGKFADSKEDALHIKLISDAVKEKLKEAIKEASNATKEAEEASKKLGERVLVVIDGVLVEMFKNSVEMAVRSGAFIVVWPGTTKPVGKGERKKGYPPIWIEDDIPM